MVPRALMLGLLCVSLTSPAFAEETTPSPSLKLPTVVFAGAVAADLTTTVVFLTHGDREGNPFLGWTNNHPVATPIAAGAMTAVGTWAWNRYVGRKHPKLARIGLYIGAFIEVGFALKNTRHDPPPRQVPSLMPGYR